MVVVYNKEYRIGFQIKEKHNGTSTNTHASPSLDTDNKNIRLKSYSKFLKDFNIDNPNSEINKNPDIKKIN